MIPKIVADRRASFVIGGQVRQLISRSKRLAFFPGADSAGEI